MFSISRKTAVSSTAVGLAVSYALAPTTVTIIALTLGALATAGAGYWCTEWLVNFPHRWNWITPLHIALCGPLGISPETRPTSYIKVSRNYQMREEVGRINLPAEYAEPDTSKPTYIVKAKLGLTDVSVTYRLAGRHPHLVIRQTPRPPGKVLFFEYRDETLAAPESAPLIGIGPKNVQVSVDLDAESPHILVNASTGGGKSVITRTMTAQMLHNGAQMSVLDIKRISHKWARGLPQVVYCRDIEEIHDELVRLGREGHRRNKIVDDWEGDDPDVGPRQVVLLEEANATISKLRRYWTQNREKTDPKESPAIDALREILFMGRAVKMHVLLVAQSATAAALGGPEVRECFATRILARYTQNAWKMLVPEVSPIPRSTRHVGRAQVVLGGVAVETQVMFLTEAEAREWAQSGVWPTPPDLSRHASHNASTWDDAPEESRDVTPDLVVIQGGRMSLAEAARQGVVPMKADALRQAKRRDPEFPAGVEGKYTAEELERWFRNRPVKQSA